LQMFKDAKENSPSKTIDIVIANAGVTGPDPIFYGDGTGKMLEERPRALTKRSGPETDEPQAPDLIIIDVNVVGTMYTTKQARHYFLKHELTEDRDRCLIILSSMGGYADVPGGAVYMASKFAGRALMRCIRRTTVVDRIRANALAPW
jgi:NAD(P)-dependent dehydrogenase (short-subunit alcohol dehydrogenase family)